MSRELLQEQICARVQQANSIMTEAELRSHFSSVEPTLLRGILDELVVRGQIFRWDREDGAAGWSSIFVVKRHPPGWVIVTDPIDEESLQSELLLLEPFSFTEFIEEVLRADPENSRAKDLIALLSEAKNKMENAAAAEITSRL